MSRPIVAIVGRPNVGKSTLFNRLCGKRIAIVEDTPGVTRDRLYADAEWLGREIVVTDTGGIIFNESDPLKVQVRQQAELAVEEADVILMLVDAAEGLAAADRDLAEQLRKTKTPVFLVANKVDNARLEQDSAEFYALGMSADRSVGASRVAEDIGNIENFLGRHRRHWYNHGKFIFDHYRSPLLCPRAPVHGAPNVTRVLLWVPRCGVNSHPALSMA